MTDMIVVIMVEVINILAIATKEVKSGRLSESISLIFTVLDSYLFLERWFKRLMGNSDIEDSLDKLDKLTQEEARVVSAESLRVNHSVDGKVMAVDNGVKVVGDRVKVVEGEVRNARSDVQDVGGKVERVEERLQVFQDDVKGVGSSMRIAGSDIKDISSKAQDVDEKVDQVNRSLSFLSLLVIPRLRQLHREPAQR
jgi:archaellum component FlaC